MFGVRKTQSIDSVLDYCAAVVNEAFRMSFFFRNVRHVFVCVFLCVKLKQGVLVKIDVVKMEWISTEFKLIKGKTVEKLFR